MGVLFIPVEYKVCSGLTIGGIHTTKQMIYSPRSLFKISKDEKCYAVYKQTSVLKTFGIKKVT